MNQPKISIITPSYNCEKFIRDCIESVLAQNYANFEHIIVDGASSDGTVEILKSFKHLKWISEPDHGEGEALNKALKLVTGDLVGWLNADDYYVKGAFEAVLKVWNPKEKRHIVAGNARFINEAGEFIWEKNPRKNITKPFLLRYWRHHKLFHQPSMFFSREVFETVGIFRSELFFSLDYEFWLRCSEKYSFFKVNQVLSVARERQDSKSIDNEQGQVDSHVKIIAPYFEKLNPFQKFLFRLDRIFFSANRALFGKLRYTLKIRTRYHRIRDRILGRSFEPYKVP